MATVYFHVRSGVARAPPRPPNGLRYPAYGHRPRQRRHTDDLWAMPVAVAALLPIVAVETLILWPILRQRFLAVFWNVFTANAISTFAGIPLGWPVPVFLSVPFIRPMS